MQETHIEAGGGGEECRKLVGAEGGDRHSLRLLRPPLQKACGLTGSGLRKIRPAYDIEIRAQSLGLKAVRLGVRA